MDKSTFQTTHSVPIHVALLRADFEKRSRANPKYSLRSFARTLNIDPSLLSKILKNQRRITLSTAKSILKKSKLSTADKKLFWESIRAERERNELVYDENTNSLTTLASEFREHQIKYDEFQLIAEPYHYVLAEIARTRHFVSDVSWIAKRLRIERTQAAEAVGRLVRVGILSKDHTGKIVRNKGRFTTENKYVTDSALKHHQRRLLEKAIFALDEVPLEKRSQNSMTIAVNPDKIPLAKELILSFINQLSSLLETGPLEEVYQLSVSLFPDHTQEPVK